MNTQPLVSVVTPFYNTAQFLEEAIVSVLRQDYPNFEYILSDNCSTDGSLEIAQRYAAQDSRIRVMTHTEFLPQVPNYNRALRYIAPDSRYCKMVQADDWVYPQCLSQMVALAVDRPRMAMVGCCYLVGDAIGGTGLPLDESVFPGRQACRTRLLTGGTYFGSPTCLMYRSDLIRQKESFLPLGDWNPDTTVCFEYLDGDAEFGRVPQILAYLRRGTNSTWERQLSLGGAAFSNYSLIERYGRRYLSEGEFLRRKAQFEREYHRMLARAGIGLAGRDYWAFHAERLASLGQQLPWSKIAGHMAVYVMEKVFNPGQTLGLAMQALRRRVERDD